MDEWLVIPCRGTCSGQYRYPEDNAQVDGIAALFAEWRSTRNKSKPAMADPPSAGRHYWIKFPGPLTLHLGTEFWLFYVEPHAIFNGFEAMHIPSMRFCRCKALRRVGTHGIRVRVLESRTVASAAELPECAFSPEWMRSAHTSWGQMNDHTSQEGYELRAWNSQGDVGGHAILHRDGEVQRLVSVHEWDFHANVHYLLNLKVS